jgi:hypothetical protein
MKKSWVLALAACVGLLGVTPLAQAVILLPGQSVPPPPLVQEGTLGPANFDMVPFTPFSFGTTGGTVSGMYREFVSIGRPGSPFSGLSFEYQFNLDPTSGPLVATFTANGFAGWDTNVTFTPGGTVTASAASRSAGTGDSITFTLTPPGVLAGQTSMWLNIDTNAPADTPNIVLLAGNGGGVTQTALGPAVPEPGTLTLTLVGLLLAGAFGYRRLCRPTPA